MTPAGPLSRARGAVAARPRRARGAGLLPVVLCALCVLTALPATAAPAPATARDGLPVTGEDTTPAPPPPDRRPPPGGEQVGAGPPSRGRAADIAGSAAVGTTRYAVPADAVHVSPSGSDTASGSEAAPVRTLARAVEAAPGGGTVVLRAGSYSENVTVPPGKRLTIQSYPGEEVWLDGSREVTGWVSDGAGWRVDGWTAQFDHSPTYTRGAADGRSPGWGFLDPARPMAAHPDMVFLDGVPQKQVGSRGAVTPGTFYVDDARDRLHLGTDPAGHEVRASTLSVALTIQGARSVVRGIGIERYATSVPEKGALRALAPDVTVENVVVRDNATQGIYVGGRDLGVRTTLRNVTAERNGMLGIESSFSDGLVVAGVRVVGNNTEGFNHAPVSGGMKICSARGLTVTDSVFADNLGTGLWFDESVHGVTVARNDVLRNAGHGISYEISSQARIAGNLVVGNGLSGLKINNASTIEIWNNTVIGNAGRPLWVVQDSRVAGNRSTPGHDPRRPLPDPSVTWLLGPVTISNNVVGGPTTATCLLCAEDTALRRTPEQIGLTVNGNLWTRPSATRPTALATWPTGSGSTRAFATIATLAAGTGQEAAGTEFTGTPAVDAAYRLSSAAISAVGVVARPVPSDIAALIAPPGTAPTLGVRFG